MKLNITIIEMNVLFEDYFYLQLNSTKCGNDEININASCIYKWYEQQNFCMHAGIHNPQRFLMHRKFHDLNPQQLF